MCEPLVGYISKLENLVCKITIFFCLLMADFLTQIINSAWVGVVWKIYDPEGDLKTQMLFFLIFHTPKQLLLLVLPIF